MTTEQAIRSTTPELAANFPVKLALERTLCGVTAAAVELIHGVDYADVMLIGGGTFRSIAPTAPVPVGLDEIQMRYHQGPCLCAAVPDSVIRCSNLGTDLRWPRFAAAAMRAGVLGMLSFQLYEYDSGAGALNLFSRSELRFDLDDEALATMLATHAAIALMAMDEHRKFQSALASRDIVGQAKGVLMERFQVDAVAAFTILTKVARENDIPVGRLALDVVQCTSRSARSS